MSKAKAKEYKQAVRQFFGTIPHIDNIADIQFLNSTKNRIYFLVGNVSFLVSGYRYSLYAFVRKKDLSVEIYSWKTGNIITKKFLQKVKEDYGKAMSDI